MFGLLVLLLLVIPVLELFVIVQVAGSIGVLATIGLLVLVSVAGTVLIRWQGMGLARSLLDAARQGRVPRAGLVDGALLLVAGLLFLLPGFLSDAVAVVLLLPPVRAALRPAALHAARRLVAPRPGSWVRVRTSGVIDVDEVRPDQPTAGPSRALVLGDDDRRPEPDGR